MAQPGNIVEGAGAGDVEDEVPTAKSAEDRKAAAALSKLDTRGDDEAAPAREVDQEAVSRAMNSLGGGAGKKSDDKKEVKKIKVDAADVALIVSLTSKLLSRSLCMLTEDASRLRNSILRKQRQPNS
jgi:hypothetical protein